MEGRGGELFMPVRIEQIYGYPDDPWRGTIERVRQGHTREVVSKDGKKGEITGDQQGFTLTVQGKNPTHYGRGCELPLAGNRVAVATETVGFKIKRALAELGNKPASRR